MSASEDYEVGLVLSIAQRNNGLLAYEAKMLADYISQLHSGLDLGMDILNAEGDHHDNVIALRELHDRAKSIAAVSVRHE